MPVEPTPHHHTIDQIDRIQAQLDQISDALAAEVAAGLIGHEIRNLLTPAVAFTQMALRETNQSPAVRRALEQSACAMRRACEVAELILATYRAPPPPSDSGSCNVASVVQDCISSLAWEDRNVVDVVVKVPSDLHAAINADSLRHVMLNLLLNAKAALPPSGGHLTIQAAEATGSTWNSTDALLITIQDDGKGIDPSMLRQISAALVDSGGRQVTRPSYSGLGLVLCQRLLRAHKGTLSLESAPPRGAIATICLPSANKNRTKLAA